MPPIRDHEMLDDDDDDMPPLVDNPNPSMTYTFHTDMTPLSYTNPGPMDASTSNFTPSATHEVSPGTMTPFSFTPPTSPTFPDEGMSSLVVPPTNPRGSHGKKRDASYIPRPPNAFILFRSSFIRSQQVPGKVEGNHSTLSKIIGMYWKTLPREEREKWEAKAVVAQAEHRKRYPDWRFRPGANAMAKQKVKDGGGSTSRKRIRIKDPPGDHGGGGDEDAEGVGGAGKAKEKGKGKAARAREKLSIEERRCAKIADLLVEGKTGEDLEVAVKEWEVDRKSVWRDEKTWGIRAGASAMEGEKSGSGSASRLEGLVTKGSVEDFDHDELQSSKPSPRSRNPERPLRLEIDNSVLLKAPSMHQHKRSLSAPAPYSRPPYLEARSYNPQSAISSTDVTDTRAIISQATPDVSPNPGERGNPYSHLRRDTNPSYPHNMTWQEAEDQRRYEDSQGLWWPESESAAGGRPPGEPVYQGATLTMGMGYENMGQFDQPYMEQFQRNPPEEPHDGSGAVNWTTTPGRQGLFAVIEDPHMNVQKHDFDSSSTPSSNPPLPGAMPGSPHAFYPSQDLAAPSSLSPISSYYPPHSPISPNLPPSSYSTLTGWAGDNNLGGTSPSGLVRDPPVSNSDWSPSSARGDQQHQNFTLVDDWNNYVPAETEMRSSHPGIEDARHRRYFEEHRFVRRSEHPYDPSYRTLGRTHGNGDNTNRGNPATPH